MGKCANGLKYDENGLVPVIVQDFKSGEVLMMAYMNIEAYGKTMETNMVHFWSRSRKKLWLKGETSGHYQYVKEIKLDCDCDALLIKVEQIEAACHTGHYSCFYRRLKQDGSVEAPDAEAGTEKTGGSRSEVLQQVYDVIADRIINPREGSYTNYLFEKGLDKILKKVGEEASEVIIAAKNKSKDEIRYETADLLYHLLVLMVERGIKLDDIYNELESRR